MEETILLRALAGEWDKAFCEIFRKYHETNEDAERQRLRRNAEANLRNMEAENYPVRVIELYSKYIQICC